MNNFNQEEFLKICGDLNAKPYIEDTAVHCPGNSYFQKVKKAVEEDRRGEVVFCVLRPNGRIITVTCEEYPSGIFRVPTGGIGYDEDIVKAVYRETMEELGLKVEIASFAGVIKIKFSHGNDSIMFYSYIFILRETGGNLLADASDDEVSEVKEVDIEGLQEIVNNLESIEGSWNDWGKFRYVTSNAVLGYLRRNPQLLSI